MKQKLDPITKFYIVKLASSLRLWDYYQLRYQLEKNNFLSVKKMSFKKTNIKEFPVDYLDSNIDGKPRKGICSLYVEAKKII